MTTTIKTFLTYDTQAEEAARLYTSVLGGRITETTRYPAGGPKPEGSVLTVAFELFGQPFVALNGGPSFTFTHGMSLMVDVETQAELDRIWRAFTSDGGEEVQCGWLVDRFGVSWQIVPRQLHAMLSDADPRRSARTMKAMMPMKKLELARLEAAYRGEA